MSSASYCVSSALNFISWSPNAAGGVEDCLCQSPRSWRHPSVDDRRFAGDVADFPHDDPLSSLGRSLGGREKIDHRGRIEIKHLRARELAVADLVEREHGAIETIAARTDPPLPPEDDHFVAAGLSSRACSASFLSRGSTTRRAGPRFFGAPASSPRSRAARQVVRCEEYNPSRRSSAPIAPGVLQLSASRTIFRLYLSVNCRRVAFATTSIAGPPRACSNALIALRS